jgi:glycosyltransferase involved in cell wall biosynthesis
MLSVVIPYRNEEMLDFTIKRLRATIRVPHEIIAVDDGSYPGPQLPAGVRNLRLHESMGVDVARNLGIRAAKYETVFVIDAHMNFWDNDWSEQLLDYGRQNPTHIACLITVGLTPDQMDMAQAEQRYAGAHLIEKDVLTDAGLQQYARRRILPDKWNSICRPGDIGSVLGGAYLLNRTWYLEELRAPWRYLHGWGWSEAIISIINFLMGGKNILLNIEIGHMFRGQSPYAIPYRSVLFNQYFLAHVVIPDEVERTQLLNHLQLDYSTQNYLSETLSKTDYLAYRNYILEQGQRTWAMYKAEWMDQQRTY